MARKGPVRLEVDYQEYLLIASGLSREVAHSQQVALMFQSGTANFRNAAERAARANKLRTKVRRQANGSGFIQVPRGRRPPQPQPAVADLPEEAPVLDEDLE